MNKNDGLSEVLIDEKVSRRLLGKDIILIVLGGIIIIGLLISIGLVAFQIIPMSFPDSYFNITNDISTISAYFIAVLLIFNTVLMFISLIPKKTKRKYASGIKLQNIIITLLAVTIISVKVIAPVYILIIVLSILFVIAVWFESSKN